MSETPQLRSITCQFPECTRPVRPSSGTGRRPSYCGLPDPHTGVVHNPKNAHLARNRSQREQAEPTLRALLADRDAAAEAPRPLSYAAVRLQDLVSDSLEEVRRAAARNDALLQVLQELAEPLRSADSARAELEAVRAEHAAELAAKNAELAQARQAVESARQAIDEAEAEAESDRAAVEPLEQQVSTLTAELEAAQTTLADQRARHQRDVEALNGQVSTLTEEIEEIRRAHQRLTADHGHAQQELAGVRDELEGTRTRLHVAEQQARDDQAARTRAEERAAAAVEKIEELTGELATARADHAAEARRAERAEQQAQETRNALATVQEQLRTASSAAARAEQQVADAHTQAEREQRRADSLQQELASLIRAVTTNDAVTTAVASQPAPATATSTAAPTDSGTTFPRGPRKASPLGRRPGKVTGPSPQSRFVLPEEDE